MFHTATELIDRTFPLIWIRPEVRREQKVSDEEWETLRDTVSSVIEQATADKIRAFESRVISQKEQLAASEIVEKYDRYSQEAIDLDINGLGRLGRYIDSGLSDFDQVSRHLTLPVRNDEGQQLVFRNFYLYRDPQVVGITSPTTRTIWLDDGNTKGTIFIGQDRSAWWYDYPERPVWSPLNLEELNRVSQAVTKVFERAKLKASL